MKYIQYLFLVTIILFTACEDDLDTFPTDQAGGAELFSDVNKAMATINGLYRAMYVTGWGTGWEHEQFGHVALMHTAGLMAEDMIQSESGSGWFYFDYKYQVKGDYTGSAGRPYSTWNFYYKIITNTNSIIASQELMSGDPKKVNNLIGQAYALRAWCYFNLARFYQQTYVGNEDAPGVPLYTLPTTIDTKSVGRGKLNDVYKLINEDQAKASGLLNPDNATPREHISNIDYYALQAMIAQVKIEQGEWQAAYAAATLSVPDGENIGFLTSSEIKDGYAFNDISKNAVMWGMEVIDDQVPSAGRAGLFGHMDASVDGFYATKARVCISNWLYGQMKEDDVRKKWWNGVIAEQDEEATGTQLSYCQLKFKFANTSTGAGDYVFLRKAEVLLMRAEAACKLADYTKAREILKVLMAERVAEYNIDHLTDDNTLTVGDDNGPTTPKNGSVTLYDEIMLQKRIELWGEHPRIYDIKRTKTGFTRHFDGSNHSAKLDKEETLNVINPNWVMSIPQAEFDGNEEMDAEKDQNPW